MGINLATSYLEHEGGSKFYETVLLECGNKGLLIKRWGPLLHNRTGGKETKIERAAAMVVRGSATKILKEKASGAKGYHPSLRLNNYGLHAVAALSAPTARDADVLNAAIRHYGLDSEAYAAVYEFLDEVSDESSLSGADTSPVTNAEPVLDDTVDRGEQWGTF